MLQSPGHSVSLHEEDSAARRERHLFGPRVPEGRGGSRNWARAAGAGLLSGLLTVQQASRLVAKSKPRLRASRAAYLVARATLVRRVPIAWNSHLNYLR